MMVEMCNCECIADTSGCSWLNFLHEFAEKSEGWIRVGCVLLWVWFACWLCSSPWASLCVCSPVWVPLDRRLSLGHRRAASGCAGSRELHSALTTEQGPCSHAALQSMNSHPGQQRCHSLKGRKNNPKLLPRAERSVRPVANPLQCAVTKETSERTGQGEAVRASQQCGHGLGCQAGCSCCAHGKCCSQGSPGSLGMLLGLPLNTRSCWIVHWTYKKPPCQVTAVTQSKSVCSVFCWYHQKGQVYSVMVLF